MQVGAEGPRAVHRGVHHTCGWVGVIDLTATPGLLDGSWQVPVADVTPRRPVLHARRGRLPRRLRKETRRTFKKREGWVWVCVWGGRHFKIELN